MTTTTTTLAVVVRLRRLGMLSFCRLGVVVSWLGRIVLLLLRIGTLPPNQNHTKWLTEKEDKEKEEKRF